MRVAARKMSTFSGNRRRISSSVGHIRDFRSTLVSGSGKEDQMPSFSARDRRPSQQIDIPPLLLGDLANFECNRQNSIGSSMRPTHGASELSRKVPGHRISFLS